MIITSAPCEMTCTFGSTVSWSLSRSVLNFLTIIRVYWTYSIDAHWVNGNAFRDHKYLLRLIVFHAGKLFSLLTASFGLLCFHNCKQELHYALETYICMYLLSLNAVILRITWHEPFLTKISFLSGSWPDVISVPFRKYCSRKSFGLASFISSIIIVWINRISFSPKRMKRLMSIMRFLKANASGKYSSVEFWSTHWPWLMSGKIRDLNYVSQQRSFQQFEKSTTPTKSHGVRSYED